MTAPGSNLERWFSPLRFALLAALLVIACFFGVVIGKETFFFRDFAIFSYPLAAWHKAAFLNGDIPMWNPYNDCGLPFLAQWNTMVFYPLSFIYLFFPLSWSLGFFCLFHFFLGALGMYFLARAWTGSSFAGALAGLSFVFGGVLLSCLKWPNNIAALGWMPWVVLFAERAWQGPWSRTGLAALAGATQMLAGAPEVILLTWVLTGLLVVTEMMLSPRLRLQIGLRFATLVILVAALSAVQLLPFLDLLRQSQRESGFTGSQWPMPIWGWLNFLLPVFRTFPSYHNVQAQPNQYWISTYYTSIGALLLAFVALERRRNARVWFLWGLLIFAIWMALGNRGGLYKVLSASVPGMGMMRFPIKFVVLAAFVIPLLAAFGAAAVLEPPNDSRSRHIVWAIAGILGAIIAGTILYSELKPFRYSTAFLTARIGLWRIIFLAAAAGCVVRILKKGSECAALLLLILIVVDGLTHTTWENPTAPRWVYDGSAVEMHPRPELGRGRAMMSPEAADTVDHLNLKSPVEDVMASRASLYCNVNLLERIPKVDGFYALYPREMAALQDRLYASTNLPPEGIMDFLAATQLTVSNTWDKWKVRGTGALPWITAPPTVREASDELDRILATNFNPRAEMFVSGTTIRTNPVVTIREEKWLPEKISFRVSSAGPAVLAISQTFYPCWKAVVNGHPAPILRANHAFQAVEVPAGESLVELRYRDGWFRAGSIISFISALFVTILMLPERKRRASA